MRSPPLVKGALQLLLFSLLGAAQLGYALEVGQAAPDFKLKGHGEVVTLSELRGQLV